MWAVRYAVVLMCSWRAHSDGGMFSTYFVPSEKSAWSASFTCLSEDVRLYINAIKHSINWHCWGNLYWCCWQVSECRSLAPQGMPFMSEKVFPRPAKADTVSYPDTSWKWVALHTYLCCICHCQNHHISVHVSDQNCVTTHLCCVCCMKRNHGIVRGNTVIYHSTGIIPD